jgi:hypothetical protein
MKKKKKEQQSKKVQRLDHLKRWHGAHSMCHSILNRLALFYCGVYFWREKNIFKIGAQ